jgi:hypothetical protein
MGNQDFNDFQTCYYLLRTTNTAKLLKIALFLH